MVYDAKPMHLADGTTLQSFGAVDIWTADHAIVLRSTWRYSKPRLSTVVSEHLSTSALVTLCSHEQANWLSSRLGPRWEPKPMQGQTIVAFHPSEPEVCLCSSDGQATWITYRADLDGSWFMTPAQNPFVVTAVQLGACGEAFGWLLPASPHRLRWDGCDWQDLATAWEVSRRRTPVADHVPLFEQMYRARLRQYPNLLGRFGALRYPVRCDHWPWLADRLNALKQGMGA